MYSEDRGPSDEEKSALEDETVREQGARAQCLSV